MEQHIANLPNGSNGHMYIVGQSGAGKSYLVFRTLLHDKMRFHFDDIFIFTMSYEVNKHYYDALHLQDKLTAGRRKRVLVKLARGEFNTYLHKTFDEWFSGESDSLQLLKKLPKDKQDIVITDLESNVLPNDDETDSKQQRIFKHFDEDKLNELFQKKSQQPNARWLFIFDDCTYDDSFTSSKTLKMLLRNGRARSISL